MTICLAMLVKNEHDHVGRCIQSVAGLIDYAVIVDTGSTDGTQDVIYDALSNHPHVNGEIHPRPWKGFAENRTELLALAAESGCDYTLMLDADMELVGDADLTGLDKDVYRLILHSAGTVYPLPLLTSTRRTDFRYEGVAHPLLVADDDPAPTVGDLDQPRLIDHRPGAHNPEKIRGDRDRLLAHLSDHPDDARSVFYLANSYRDLQDHRAAIDTYLTRAQMEGPNEEEVYCSLLMAGILCCRHVSVGQGMPMLLDAWIGRPWRAEALRVLAAVASDMADRLPVPSGEQGYVLPADYGPRDTAAAGVDPKDVCAIVITRGDVPLDAILETLPYGETIIVYPGKVCYEVGSKIMKSESMGSDLKVYGRYAAIHYTDKPVIYFQDDDIVFTEHTALCAAYEPGRIVTNMDPQWIADCGYHDLCMVATGSLMDRDLPMPYLDRYRAAYPDDDRFLLDADFALGVLAPHKKIWIEGVEILEVASAPNRLWRQPEQMAGKWRTINRAKALRDSVIKRDMADLVGAKEVST